MQSEGLPRSISTDLRSCGKSSALPERNAYTVLHTVGEFMSLLDALNLPGAVLVGWGTQPALYADQAFASHQGIFILGERT
ncbi:MAG TPA: hypothetical protein VF493_10755 [Terriglobales bacterium]